MRQFTRRDFLATSSTLAAGAFAARTLRAEAKPTASPNDSIVLGFIGVGGMGRGLLNTFTQFPDVRVAALCDVHEPHLLQAKEQAESKDQRPDTYKDFRKILDRNDIDAVVVATPDHWHAIPTVLACLAEKDVYCEKPLAFRIGEGRRIVDAAHKTNRVTQMGNLIHAGETYHRIAEIVQSGVLGKISKARVWMARDNQDFLGNPSDTAPPEGCDYDFWLGPAPKRPFNPNRFTFNWRFFWDYGGGFLTDFVCHLVDPVHWGMQATAPETIAAHGGRYVLDDNGETPDSLEVLYHYPENWDLVWSFQSRNPHGFHGRSAGIEFVGTRGTLHGHYSDYVIIPNSGEEIEEPEPFLPRSPGHHREWLDKIKTREQCSCHFEYGHQITNVGHLGNMALWSGQVLHWDGETERVTNCDEANRYLFREEYRSPWDLPDV